MEQREYSQDRPEVRTPTKTVLLRHRKIHAYNFPVKSHSKLPLQRPAFKVDLLKFFFMVLWWVGHIQHNCLSCNAWKIPNKKDRFGYSFSNKERVRAMHLWIASAMSVLVHTWNKAIKRFNGSINEWAIISWSHEMLSIIQHESFSHQRQASGPCRAFVFFMRYNKYIAPSLPKPTLHLLKTVHSMWIYPLLLVLISINYFCYFSLGKHLN